MCVGGFAGREGGGVEGRGLGVGRWDGGWIGVIEGGKGEMGGNGGEMC